MLAPRKALLVAGADAHSRYYAEDVQAMAPDTVDLVIVPGADHVDLYVWIAGESKVVTGLRRVLVRDLGLDRRQVAFMGYWRVGVSMAS